MGFAGGSGLSFIGLLFHLNISDFLSHAAALNLRVSADRCCLSFFSQRVKRCSIPFRGTRDDEE
jgi:hypothetical protein